jgi:hypothetical protein
VAGERNTKVLFGPPETVDPNMFHLLLMDTHWGAPKNDIRMFENDKSGRQKAPLPGTEHTDPSRRHWHTLHQIYAEYLSNVKYTGIIANTFFDFFTERLNKQPLTEWTTVTLFEYLKAEMMESAVKSIFGTRLLVLNPDLARYYWEFDEVAVILVWGLTKFIKPEPWRIRERLHSMVHEQVEEAWEKFDWDGPDADSD